MVPGEPSCRRPCGAGAGRRRRGNQPGRALPAIDQDRRGGGNGGKWRAWPGVNQPTEGKDQYVFVVVDGTACKIKLDTGYEDRAFIEALSEIQPGMPVIVIGQDGLRDHAQVKVGSV